MERRSNREVGRWMGSKRMVVEVIDRNRQCSTTRMTVRPNSIGRTSLLNVKKSLTYGQQWEIGIVVATHRGTFSGKLFEWGIDSRRMFQRFEVSSEELKQNQTFVTAPTKSGV